MGNSQIPRGFVIHCGQSGSDKGRLLTKIGRFMTNIVTCPSLVKRDYLAC